MPETKTAAAAATSAGKNSYRVRVRSHRDLGNYKQRVFLNDTIQANDISVAEKLAEKAKNEALAVKAPDFDSVIVKIYEAVGVSEPQDSTDFQLAFVEEYKVKKSKS